MERPQNRATKGVPPVMGRRLDRYASSSTRAAEEFAAPHSTSRCYRHQLRGDRLGVGAGLDFVDRSDARALPRSHQRGDGRIPLVTRPAKDFNRCASHRRRTAYQDG